ncbi:U2 small nuclear ribonucleoprotein B'', partial [Coemansia sp. RSA 486]
FVIRLDQIKLIFPKYDVIGWYVVNSSMTINRGMAELHKTFLNRYPSALMLVFDSSFSGSKGLGNGSGNSMSLPIAVYETLAPTRVERSKLQWDHQANDKDVEREFYVENISDSSIQLDFGVAWASRLLPMRLAVESGEAERIAVEHVANMSRQTTDVDPSGIVSGSVYHGSSSSGDGVNASKMASFLSGQLNALNMLHKDILILKEYVGDVIAGRAPFDPDVMQLVQRVLSNKPVVKNDEQFDLAMTQEETNYQLASYLNAATSTAATVRELSQRSNIALSSARSRHAAYINPSPAMLDGGMSDMMSMFGGGDRYSQVLAVISIQKDVLKRALYSLCISYGRILDIITLKTMKMRGQAFVVFDDITSATAAMRQLSGKHIFGKPISAEYALSKSEVVAKDDGSYRFGEQRKQMSAKERKKLLGVGATAGSKRRPPSSESDSDVDMRSTSKRIATDRDSDAQSDENDSDDDDDGDEQMAIESDSDGSDSSDDIGPLPPKPQEEAEEKTKDQYNGFREVRQVAGKKDIAFVDYDTAEAATAARDVLDGFRISKNFAMKVEFSIV